MGTPLSAVGGSPVCERSNALGADAGFTLIEMLVSLSLLALAAVLVGQSLTAQRSFLTRGERRLSADESVGAAQDLIRARVERLSAQTRVEGPAAFVDIAGAEDQLSFSSLVRRSQGEGVQPQHLFATPNGQLRLESAAVSTDASGPLLTGVKRLEIAYYGAVAGDGTRVWRPAWLRQPQPPELLRVRVLFEDSARRWPDLIVRPTVTVDSACLFDAAVGECRTRS